MSSSLAKGDTRQRNKARFARARLKGGSANRVHRRPDDVDEEAEVDDGAGTREMLSRLVLDPGDGKFKAKRLAYLNGIANLWERRDSTRDGENREGIGDVDVEEVMKFLRLPIIDESTEVRAAGLRTLRCIMRREEDVSKLINLNMHYLVTRCLDIDLDNKLERVHAVRLARKLIFLAPRKVPEGIVRCLVAIAECDYKETDRLKNTCLAVLCELSVFNSELFIYCNGVQALTHSLLDCSMPRITEAMIGSLLRLHSNPGTRNLAQIDFSIVAAPFTEFAYVHDDVLPRISDETEHRHRCGKHAILALLHSWTGTLHLSNSLLTAKKPTLKAIVDVLYLSNEHVRLLVIGFLAVAVGVTLPKESESYSETLDVLKRHPYKDQWKLAEGFVTMEGNDVLPNLIKSRPNLLECHRSFLLTCLLHAKLPDALVRVIVTAEQELSVRATVFLGEFLHLVYTLLPPEVNVTSHCLPSLLAEVSLAYPERSDRASEAVAALEKIHALKKNSGICPNSLFLEELLAHSELGSSSSCVPPASLSPSRLKQAALFSSASENVLQNVQRSGEALLKGSFHQWDWDLITSTFKWRSERQQQQQQSWHFEQRMVEFFKPSSGQFSKLELSNKLSRMCARSGFYLLDFLVKCQPGQGRVLLDDLLMDVKNQLELLTKSDVECLLSPTKVATTACQYYFLFIGRLSRTTAGRQALDRHSILLTFFELLNQRSDMYLKLALTCLDYSSHEWGSRHLLEKVCRDSNESSRLYATRLLGVLLRCRTPYLTQWTIDILVGQLFSPARAVSMAAFFILDEVCEDRMNLEATVCALSPKCSALAMSDGESDGELGFRGTLLLTRFLASASGLKLLRQTGLLGEQLQFWADEFNVRYVSLVEELLNDGLTHHQRDERGVHYGRRRSHESYRTRDVFVPAHIYGQLAATSDGLEILKQEEPLKALVRLLRSCTTRMDDNLHDQEELVRLKAAIWAVCHASSTPEAVQWLEGLEEEGGLTDVIALAERCPYLAVRGTAFYALSLVATHRPGARRLESMGWCCLKHSKDEKWPVLEQSKSLQQMTSVIEQEMEVREAELQRPEEPSDRDSFETTESAPLSKERTPPENISTRKRLSNMFRSFSLSNSSDRKDAAAKWKKQQSNFRRDSEEQMGLEIHEQRQFSPPSKREESGSDSASLTNIDEETTPSANLDELAEADIRLDQQKQQRPRVAKRSGQRAHSESEATSSMTATAACIATAGGTPLLTMASSQHYFRGGQSITSVTSSGGSWNESPGYQTLRSLHERRRPILNDSAEGDGAAENNDVRDGGPSSGTLVLHRASSWKKTKARALDYGSLGRGGIRHRPHLSLVTRRAAGGAVIEHGPEPRYWGIALPVQYEKLFLDESREEVSEVKETRKVRDRIDMWMRSHSEEVRFNIHSRKDCLICCEKSTDSTGNGVEEDSSDDQLAIRRDVLKLVACMNASVGAKSAEQGLLKLKQKHPSLFSNVCIYSEVCLLLAKHFYRLSSRRFIQELFLTLNPDGFRVHYSNHDTLPSA